MFLPVTTVSFCILAMLFIYLSFKVIDQRRAADVSLGDGGDELLQRRMRGQANLCEYGPFGMFLILIAELQSANFWLLMIIAAIFVIGRLMHGYGFGAFETAPALRMRGMYLTVTGLFLLVGLNLWGLVAGFFN